MGSSVAISSLADALRGLTPQVKFLAYEESLRKLYEPLSIFSTEETTRALASVTEPIRALASHFDWALLPEFATAMKVQDEKLLGNTEALKSLTFHPSIFQMSKVSESVSNQVDRGWTNSFSNYSATRAQTYSAIDFGELWIEIEQPQQQYVESEDSVTALFDDGEDPTTASGIDSFDVIPLTLRDADGSIRADVSVIASTLFGFILFASDFILVGSVSPSGSILNSVWCYFWLRRGK